MSRYSKQHYEDVARLLTGYTADDPDLTPDYGARAAGNITLEFADLFAADNPPVCQEGRAHEGKCDAYCLHSDFNREQFLAACGLEPNCPLCSCPSKDGDVHLTCADTEQAYSDYVAGKIAGEFE